MITGVEWTGNAIENVKKKKHEIRQIEVAELMHVHINNKNKPFIYF